MAEAEEQGAQLEQSTLPTVDTPSSPAAEREVTEAEGAGTEAPVSVAIEAYHEGPAVEDQAATPRATALLRSPEWLSEQPPDSLTIQLVAGENIESIQGVADKFGLQGEIFTVRTEREGRDWYPLLWGRFKGMTSASEALKRLPPELQTGGAWIRSFASLYQ
jgi:DamX protein